MRGRLYTSKFGDEVARGTARQLVEKYEALAIEHLLDKNDILARHYCQHAEHWRKVARDER